MRIWLYIHSRCRYYPLRVVILLWLSLIWLQGYCSSDTWALSISSVNKPPGAAVGWQVPRATIRVCLKKDESFARVPDVFLSELVRDRKLSRRTRIRLPGKGRRSYARLYGKYYNHAIGVVCPADFAYPVYSNYTRFVARVGQDDRTSDSEYASFSIYADDKKLYQTDRLYRNMPPVSINVKIPAHSHYLKIHVEGNGRRRPYSILANAGFILSGHSASVSEVKLSLAGINPEHYYVVMMAGKNIPIGSKVLYNRNGVGTDVLFDSSKNAALYYMYFVPRAGNSFVNMVGWSPRAGLMLESRYLYKYTTSVTKLVDLQRQWLSGSKLAGAALIDAIHLRTDPVDELTSLLNTAIHSANGANVGNRSGFSHPRITIRKCTGFFRVSHNGTHTFATASLWGSFIFIDNKLIVSWAGSHNFWGGIRGLHDGKIYLKRGIHKIEYYNASPTGQCFMLSAWQKPGGSLKVMTRGDFMPVGRYKPVAVSYNLPGNNHCSFSWQIIDDLRDQSSHPKGTVLVAMHFGVIPDEYTSGYTYRWAFDDSTNKPQTANSGTMVSKTGLAANTIDTVARRPVSPNSHITSRQAASPAGDIAVSPSHITHIFITGGMHRVTLSVIKNGKIVNTIEQDIFVHKLLDKFYVDMHNADFFYKRIFTDDLYKRRVKDLVALYDFANRNNLKQWQEKTAVVLFKRLNELIANPQYAAYCLQLGYDLRSSENRLYNSALDIFMRLATNAPAFSSVRQKAQIAEAETLILYLNRARQGLAILEQATGEARFDKKTALKVRLLKARGLMAIGKQDEANKIIDNLTGNITTGLSAKQQNQLAIKIAGMIRNARKLANIKNDPTQLEYADTEIDNIITEYPRALVDPELNLTKLDILLARREYLRALYLCERISNIELSESQRCQIITRKVAALCGLNKIDEARQLYETLQKNYPFSQAVNKAREIIIQSTANNK